MNAWKWVTSRAGRMWLYSVSLCVVPILVMYGVISKESAPLWIALVAAFLGVAAPAMALAHVPPKATSKRDSKSSGYEPV